MITLSNSYPVTGNGLGGLSDVIEATVTHEINGQYEMSMRYPVTGQHYDDIETGRVIMAKPDSVTDAQPFTIYRITKPLNGIVTVYARHLCYEMQGIVVEPFSAGSLTEAFQTIPAVCAPASPITLSTTRTVASGMSIKEPRPLWKLIGGQEGSILDVYGGEWDFDKDEAKLVTQLGADRGISIRYGKNMTQMEQDATIESTYSAVYPFWYDEETNVLVKLTEKFVPVTGSIVADRVLVMDCTDDFDNQPTEQQLRDRANAYITANSVGAAKTSWKVSFLSVPEADRPSFDRVTLGDTLSVFYERLGVNGTARVVKTEYDCLADRFKALTVGRVKQNLASIIVENEKKTESEFAQVKSALETAVDDATDFIRNGQGYMRFIYNQNNELVEIVSLDDPDITQAQKVWRWNNGGFGFSSTGYNGPYTLAITQNGAIVADFITAGTLNANVVKAGILQDALGKNSWNLDTGDLTITDGKLTARYEGPVTIRRDKFDPDPNPATNPDMLELRSIIMRGAPFSQEELDKYDLNGDGILRMSDLIKLRNLIFAGADQQDWRIVTIDPTVENAVDIVFGRYSGVVDGETHVSGSGVSSSDSYYTEYGNEVTTKTAMRADGFHGYTNNTETGFVGVNCNDYVIEQGTINSWTYRKWNSGLCECWYRFPEQTYSFTSWGTVYYCDIPAVAYPFTFATAPYEIASTYGNNSAWFGRIQGNSTTKSWVYECYRPVSGNASVGVEIYVAGMLA